MNIACSGLKNYALYAYIALLVTLEVYVFAHGQFTYGVRWMFLPLGLLFALQDFRRGRWLLKALAVAYFLLLFGGLGIVLHGWWAESPLVPTQVLTTMATLAAFYLPGVLILIPQTPAKGP